jgi:hypothetical protein
LQDFLLEMLAGSERGRELLEQIADEQDAAEQLETATGASAAAAEDERALAEKADEEVPGEGQCLPAVLLPGPQDQAAARQELP